MKYPLIVFVKMHTATRISLMKTVRESLSSYRGNVKLTLLTNRTFSLLLRKQLTNPSRAKCKQDSRLKQKLDKIQMLLLSPSSSVPKVNLWSVKHS